MIYKNCLFLLTYRGTVDKERMMRHTQSSRPWEVDEYYVPAWTDLHWVLLVLLVRAKQLEYYTLLEVGIGYANI